LKASKSF